MLYSTEPWWNHLTAQVRVQFLDSARIGEIMSPVGGSTRAHWLVNVRKVAPGTTSRGVTHRPDGRPPHGDALLDSEALEMQPKTGGHSQRAAVHESGHKLGLADLYTNPEHPEMQEAFLKRANKELGVTPPVANDTRLMSTGEQVDQPDAISFVEAIRAATGRKWSIFPGKAKHIPHDPERMNDLVRPRETVG